MKKLIALLLICCSIGVYAQDVRVSYRSDMRMYGLQQGLFDFNEILYFEVTLEGKLEGKSITILEVRCDDGEFSEKEILHPYSLLSDTTTVLRFYGKSLSPDSIRVGIGISDIAQVNVLSVPLKQTPQYYIFMETYDSALGVMDTVKGSITYTLGKPFPVIAYTTGILSGSVMENGVSYPLVNYCALRDKHQNPALWYESSGIQNYIYYVINFE